MLTKEQRKEAARRTSNAIAMKKKNKMYEERRMESELNNIHYRGMEKTMRKKVGQF
ncbi:MAG: hypothetical protein Q8936_01810 [Bacillota bacterium]|nr:hypothetical protein [Bacillota bacterium]